MYEFNEDYIKLITQSEKYGLFEFIIDLDEYDKIKNIHWGLNAIYGYTDKYENVYYAFNSKLGFLHRFIMNAPKGMVVDHIDGNTLNTRKNNLRICTHTENCRNRKRQFNNTSGYQGVTWDKNTNKWMSYICVDTHQKTLGYFNTPEEAHVCRVLADEKYFGEYSRPIELQ